MTDINSWLAQTDEIDLDDKMLDGEGLSFPFAQWVYGDPALKKLGPDDVSYGGGWFIPADRIDADELPGWTRGELTHAGGEMTEGFFANALKIAVLHYRRSWRIFVGDRQQFFTWDQYDEAKAAGALVSTTPTGRLQVLGVIKGLEDIGPMMLTVKGSASAALAPGRGIMGEFKRLVLDKAAKMARKAGRKIKGYPRHLFWMPVGAERDAKGLPVFTKVGQGDHSKQVVLPALIGVDSNTNPGELFVGGENARAFTELWDETEPWATAWDEFAVAEDIATSDDPITEEEFEGAPF